MKLGMRPQDMQMNPAIQFQRQAQTQPTGLQATQHQPGKDLSFGGQSQGHSNPFSSGGGSGHGPAGLVSTQGINHFEGIELGKGSGIKSATTGMDNPTFQASLTNRPSGVGNVMPLDPTTATVGNRLSVMG